MPRRLAQVLRSAHYGPHTRACDVLDRVSTRSVYARVRVPERRVLFVCLANSRGRGIGIGDLRTRPFEQSEYELFDEIVVPDHQNLRDILARSPNEDEHARVSLLLADPEEDVADPVLGERADSERAFDKIATGCDLLLERTRRTLTRPAVRSA